MYILKKKKKKDTVSISKINASFQNISVNIIQSCICFSYCCKRIVYFFIFIAKA